MDGGCLAGWHELTSELMYVPFDGCPNGAQQTAPLLGWNIKRPWAAKKQGPTFLFFFSPVSLSLPFSLHRELHKWENILPRLTSFPTSLLLDRIFTVLFMPLHAVDVHTYSFLGGPPCSASTSLGYNFEILPAELFSVTPRQRGVYPQFYIESDATVAQRLSWASRLTVPAWGVRRTCGDKWQLYLCVLHESIKHWPFKNAPRIFEAVRSRGPNWDAA